MEPYSSRSAVRYSARGGRSVFYRQQSQSVARRMAATCHRRGRVPADDHMEKRALSLAQKLSGNAFAHRSNHLDESGLPCRVPGTAVFLSAQPKGAPASLLHNIRHNRVLHQRNIVLTIVTDRIPYVQKNARVEIKDLSHGFYRIIAHFGFMETPTIGEVIESCALKNFVIEEQKASFFLGRETIIPTQKPGMARWREHLFVAMTQHAQRPAEFFKLPVTRTIELGGQVEI
jgi:K+ transporter